ncbi:long-chain-fatty-acid--CoA ligase ACSBG2-like isoform X2 [Ambystoma mexicanum]
MAVNGSLKEDCKTHTESNCLADNDFSEEAYESFDNISPCKREELPSPAVAGHGAFLPAYDDTVSMLIIHGIDPTQLEGNTGETTEIIVNGKADSSLPVEFPDTALAREFLEESVSSVSLDGDIAECSAPSEIEHVESAALWPSPLREEFEALATTEPADGITFKHFPRNFLVSAESTPLKHQQDIQFTKGHLHNYIKGRPGITPVDGSLELSAETSSIANGIIHQGEVIEVCVEEAQDGQQLQTPLENDQFPQWQYKETSMGLIPIPQDVSLEATSGGDAQCLGDQSPENGILDVRGSPGGPTTAISPVREGTAIANSSVVDGLTPQEHSGPEGDYRETTPRKETEATAEVKEKGEVPPVVEEEWNVIHQSDQTTTEVNDPCSPSTCDGIVPDTSHNCHAENVLGATSQAKDILTSVALDDDLLDIKLAPASSLCTTVRDGAVRLRIEPTGPAAEPPVTVHQMFKRTLKRYGDLPALAVKKDEVWEYITYSEYYQHCRTAAKGFLKLGLERFHGVGILGFNSPEWFIADIGAILAGGFAVGIYTTNSPEACQYVAENCNANILVVQNHRQLSKILQVQDQLPHLKAIIQYQDELRERRPNLYTWKEFIQLAADVPDSQLDSIIGSQKANQCCTLIYTSGTTGHPKGAMLSHDNLTWVVKRAGEMLGLGEQEVLVSYLPLSHIAAQVVDIWIPMYFGGTTYFADPDALKGSLVTTLREVRPTGFLGVPRVWEKIQEKMKALGAKSSIIQRKVASWAKGIGLQASYNLMNGVNSMPWGYTLANILVFRRVHAALGLDRCVRCYTGAAPITKDTLEYFMSLNIPVLELYGMSESTGPHTLSVHSAFRIMSTGKEIPGCKTLIYNPEEDGTGEICFWGRHVFMGYLNMEEKTKEALDEEGWLHSGDLGKQDEDGFLFITGRIKELIITAGGENVPPIPIEDAIKEELSIISNAMLIGDKMKFLSMLLTLKCTTDADTGEPQDELTPEALQFCQRLGSSAKRVSEVVCSKDSAVYKAIQEGVDRVNRRAASNAQRVQKWIILDKDFSVAGGELGPTMKLKRPTVSKMYKEVIDNFYKESAP